MNNSRLIILVNSFSHPTVFHVKIPILIQFVANLIRYNLVRLELSYSFERVPNSCVRELRILYYETNYCNL